MIKNLPKHLFLTGLILAGSHAMAQFSGPFDPANWTLTGTSAGSDASVNTAGAPASITFTGNDSYFGDCCGLYDQYTVTVPVTCDANTLITFDYNFDQPDIEEFYYVVNGVATFVTDQTQTGSVSAVVPSGGTFAFRIYTDDDCCGAGVLTVTNFVFDSDYSAPVASLASLSDVTGSCSVNAPAAPTANDGCSGTITGTTTTIFPVTSVGTTVVTWTYDDGNGNISTQDQNIIVTNSAPVADLASLSDVTGSCSVNAPTAPTATDDCSGTITGTTTTVFPVTVLGTTIVTWTYDDGDGNIITQDQNIIVTDDVAPVPDVASLADVTAGCSVNAPVAPTATDNCSGTITGTTTAVFPITVLGTTVVTWTYDDGNGNIVTQDQNIIVTNTLSLSATTTLENAGNDGAIDLTVTGNTGTVTFDWDNDGTGDNDDSEDLTGLVAGTYNVTATDAGCSATLAVVVNNVGLTTHEIIFAVYPNPTNGMITISVEGSEVIMIRIMDATGRIVAHLNDASNMTQIDLSDFGRGIYFIELQSGNDTSRASIILQ